MFGKKKDAKAVPAANENGAAQATAPAKTGFKDKPRPVTVYRDEAAKTSTVQKEAAEQRGVVDTKLGGLLKKYKPTVDSFDQELTTAGEARIQVRRETVESLTNEVGASKALIAELEKKLAEEYTKLNRSSQSLNTATKELNRESGKIAKEHKAAMKAKKKELGTEISSARKDRNTVYSQTGKRLRSERWKTFANTTKETLAVVPDLTMRFAKAAKRGVCEVFSVFARSAKSAQKGFGEPTVFSIRRQEPLNPPKKEKKAKPTPPAPQQ